MNEWRGRERIKRGDDDDDRDAVVVFGKLN